MIIQRLSISGFGIIGDPLEIPFPEECRLGIFGSNESGKTTLLEAIEYALYGLKKGPSTEEQRENVVTWGKDRARLEIEFTSGQERYVLERIISVKSGHSAKLTHMADGSSKPASVLTSVREIESKIEEITGMDRDSFTKLVYIKQKDLDALKDLKTKRVEFFNKVMGIEVFDAASEKVKDDAKRVQEDLKDKSSRMEFVSRSKEQYELKQRQRSELEAAASSLKQTLRQKKVQLDDAKDLLEKYEWLYARKSADEVLSSLRDQLESAQKDLKEVADLEERLRLYEDSLEKYRLKIEELGSLKVVLSDFEGKLKEAKDSVASLEAKIEESVAKTGVAKEDLEMLSQGLSGKKRSRLIAFGVSLATGLSLIVGGILLTNLIITLAGVVSLSAFLFMFRSYLKIDSLLARSNEVLPLLRQQAEQNEKINDLETQIDREAEQHGYRSSEEVETVLNSTLDELYAAVEIRSVQGLEAIVADMRGRLNKLKFLNPSGKVESLQIQIQEKEKELENLEKTEPLSVDELVYDRSQHETARQAVNLIQDGFTSIDKDLHSKVMTINNLDIDLFNLAEDYDLYPKLDEEIKGLEDELNIRKLLLNELSETSKELRNKVIPYARYIINDILPRLTGERYSDFEITEDLRFKVHSMDAGGYKEREIFSGGTQDQFLIALRLAFTQSILDSRVMADKYSLLMDECISSSDETRKQGIFEVLEEMKKTFSQIFIIAHEDISTYVDHFMVLGRNQRGYTEIRSRSW